MINTGKWTSYHFVKYLTSIQSTLTPQEIELLRRGSVFAKEGAGNEQSASGTNQEIQRYDAMDLYEPVDIFRELGIPVIDWGADNLWRPSSNEGEF